MNARLLVFSALLLGALIASLVFEPSQYLNLDWLKTQQADLQTFVAAEPLRAALIGFAIYAAATAFSVPGALVMTLAAGAVFGVLWGSVIVSFASTVGATGAFLMSRYLFRGLVQSRLGHRLNTINRGIINDGPIYLLTLRLIPVVPFVAINLLMALTPIRLRHFYLYSQLGMLPATVVYVNAGTQLAAINQLSDIASPGVLLSLAALAAVPFLAKALVAVLKRRRLDARYPKPAATDRNLIVIGGGSAGLVASVIASSVRSKVTLIEQSAMGGDCLNTGCVPSKSLLHVARVAQSMRDADALGLKSQSPEIDFPGVMKYVQSVIQTIEPHDSIERFEAMGVECIQGHATIRTPYEVDVNGQRLSTRNIIIASGAYPTVPPIDGLGDVEFVTSDTVWNLQSLPARLLVLGGGPIGCELAQAFARLGSQVTLVEMDERLIPREDPSASHLLAQALSDEGVDLRLATRAVRFEAETASGSRAVCRDLQSDNEMSIGFDVVLLALGRTPNLDNLGLEELQLARDENNRLVVNEYLQTSIPSIYVCGDALSEYQFTHTASHEAWYATVNALFGRIKRFAVDYRVVPWCTFTDPEIARVGLNETEAQARGLDYEISEFPLDTFDRAVADNAAQGFIRILTPPGSDRILGVTIVGAHAGDSIAEFVLAMRHNIGLKKLLGTIHIYPTYPDANKLAAGAWRRKHAPQRILRWLQKFHRWQREGRG